MKLLLFGSVLQMQSWACSPAVAIPDPIWLALAFVAMAGALLILGRRGRRIGDAPHCVHCNYNLQSLDSTNCPECGAVVEHSRIRGQYRPRPTVVLIGLALVVMAVRVVYPVVNRALSRMNPYPHYPFSLVLADANTGNGKAIRELGQRVRHSELPAVHHRELIEVILNKRQQNLPPGQFGPWRRMLLQLYDANRLTQTEVQRYAQLQLQAAKAGRRHGINDLQTLAPQLPLESLQLVITEALDYARDDSCVWLDPGTTQLTDIFPRGYNGGLRHIHRWIRVVQVIGQRPDEEARQLVVDSILDTYERASDPNSLDPHWLQVLLETTPHLAPIRRDEVRSRLTALADELETGVLVSLIEQALAVDDAVRMCAEERLDELLTVSIDVRRDIAGNTAITATVWIVPPLHQHLTITLRPVLTPVDRSDETVIHTGSYSGDWTHLLPFSSSMGLGTRTLQPGQYYASILVGIEFAGSEYYPVDVQRPLSKTVTHTKTIVVR